MFMPNMTKEEFDKLSFEEKVRVYAKDVMATENSDLRLGYTRESIDEDGNRESEKCSATYPAGEGEYTYSFLFGGGCLGHPRQPSLIGRAVCRIAKDLNAGVSFKDFTYATFNKKLNQEVIEKEFKEVWEELLRRQESK